MELTALEKVYKALMDGKPARRAGLTAKEVELVRGMMFLTMKPVIFAANVAECDLAAGNELSAKVFAYAAEQGETAVLVSAQVRVCVSAHKLFWSYLPCVSLLSKYFCYSMLSFSIF
jgi:ribosome-binding ATPase